MSLASQVGVLATRIGTEVKTLRSTLVPNSQRGPIGGISESTGVTGPVNLDPALSNHRRLTATGDITFGLMPPGTDGQRLLLEINASAGQRTVSFDPAYEVSQAVPVRSFVVDSGNWAYIALVARGTAWRLVSAEPLSVTTSPTAPSSWFPADYGYLAWSIDPILTTSVVGNGASLLIGSNIKCDVSGTATQVTFNISAAGAGFTANRNYIGVYNPAGTLIAQTADLASSWSSTGTKTVSFVTSVSMTPGVYYVGFICTATTGVQFTAMGTTSGLVNAGRTALGYRGGFHNTTTYTSLPVNRPVPNSTVNGPWFGIS